jgi:hypothetical protein
MVQLLLQGRGVRLNPVTTMYYVAPVCLGCLLPAFAASEARAVLSWPAVPAARLLASAAAAFALNCSVFLLIGRTSALTMNVGGVVKDWLLIAASVALHGCGPRGAGPEAPAAGQGRSCGPARSTVTPPFLRMPRLRS